MERKFTYIVGVSLLVLLVLIVYVGSRVQNLEMGVVDLDARLASIEAALGVTDETSFYDLDGDGYDDYEASLYDSYYGEDPYYDYEYAE